MLKEILIKGSIEAGVGAGLAVVVNAFLLDNSGIWSTAVAAGVGAALGNLFRVFVLKRNVGSEA